MSELIAEARVLVTPDTTNFRPLLIAQVNAAAKGVTVPISVTPVVTGVTGTAGTAALTASQAELATSVSATSAALAQEQALLARGGVLLDNVATKEARVASETAGATAVRRAATASMATQTRQLGQLERGVGATALSFAGLRGATLAASGPFIAGAAAAVTFSKALGLASGFASQLNVLKVTSGATADQMERVSAAAQALGRDISLPGVSAVDAAQAMTELSKAGLSVEDSIGGARGVLQLATAAQIDNASATELAASALNAFGLAGDQAVHVADVLANSANDAQGSITDIGIALSQAAAAGRQAGLSLEQTVGILTEFARAGIKGSDAGTLLRTLLIRLINPTDKAAKIIKQLGLNLRDASGSVRVDVFQQFADATRNLTAAERDRDAAIIAGQDAFRGLTILARQGNAALDAQVASLNRAGTAAEIAAARNAGLQGSVANLQNQLENVGLEIGQFATGPIQTLIDQFAAGVVQVDKFIAEIKVLGGAIPSLPAIQIGPIDTEKQGRDLGGQVVSAFGIARDFAVRSALTGGPTGGAALTLLEKLFPPKSETDAAGARAGANLRSAIEDASREAVQAANDAGIQISGALGKAFSVVGDALASGIKNQVTAASRGVTQGQNQQTGLDDILNQVLLGGGTPQQQIAQLQKQFSVQQGIIDAASAGLTGLTSGDKGFATFTKAVRDARDKQVQINGQIEAIQGQVAADQQARAATAQQDKQAAQTAAAKADQDVLDSFAPAQNRLDIAAITANATARLSDNVKLQTAIITEAEREKKIIQDTVKGVQTRNAALAAQAKIIKAAEVERTRLLGEIAQAATENRKKAADAITATLGQRIQLAELRGNDNAEVQAINKAIADEKKRIANFKKLGLNLLDEKIALQELINKRDDILKTAQDATQGGLDAGTTLVDLFKSTQEIANASGNVGRLPSQLTTSAANAPIRDLVNQRLDIQLANPGGEALAKSQMSTTERLITTLDQLIQVIGPGPGIQVGGNQGSGTGLPKAIDTAARFRYQRVANSIVEAGVWG